MLAPASLVARVRSLWRGLWNRSDVESEMADEFRHHVELRTADLVRSGVAPEEAARRARLEFGHADSHKSDARGARGLRAFDQVRFSWLDVKLGLRMLVRYPGLTLVGGLAMAFAIFVGAGTFHFINQFLDPTLPLPAGERIVGLRYWDRTTNDVAFPGAEDLDAWHGRLRTVTDLAAFRTEERTLVIEGRSGEPVQLAAMTPEGFRVAGIAPLMGRTLTDADAQPGAPAAMVIGYDVWQARFDGDPSILGRAVRLRGVVTTVVGVMPDGFGFPRDHEAWVPLPRAITRGGVTTRPDDLRVFGRLAPGVTREEAELELGAVTARAARDLPERYDRLQAQVLPFPESLSGLQLGAGIRVLIYQLNVYAALFLVLVSANVALLMFARTATREREIVVRTALGASRGRIVMQLFVEALVLAVLASIVGLAGTGPALAWIERTLVSIGGPMPFWFDPTVSVTTATYTALLAILSAIVAGVVPALKATGRGMRARLNAVGAGAGGLRLGGIWTAVVVTQIAATVAFTGVAYILARQATRIATVETHFPAEQYLGVRLEMDRHGAPTADAAGDSAFTRLYAAHVRELGRRVAEQPGVAGVTLTERLPLKSHATRFVEVEEADVTRPGGPANTPADSVRPRHEVYSGAIDLQFLDVFRAPILAGRAFDSRDLARDARTVIVTSSFVEEVLGGRGAVGQRIRYSTFDGSAEPGPWYEIVGVVRDLVADRTRSLDIEAPPKSRVYHALDPVGAGTYPVHLVAHMRGTPGDLVPALHRMAESISPELRVHEPLTLDRANSDLAVLWGLYARLLTGVSGIALFLSLAGIYAVMSFTVARRTREIGVRVALGARPGRVIAEIFRNPLVQVVSGVSLGCVLVAAIVWMLTSGRASLGDAWLLLAWGAGMLVVCALACVGPTVRALRVEPREALGTEG